MPFYDDESKTSLDQVVFIFFAPVKKQKSEPTSDVFFGRMIRVRCKIGPF